MLIISTLKNFQAKTQAIFERHNFWLIAPDKGSKISGKIGNECLFYEPFIELSFQDCWDIFVEARVLISLNMQAGAVFRPYSLHSQFRRKEKIRGVTLQRILQIILGFFHSDIFLINRARRIGECHR